MKLIIGMVMILLAGCSVNEFQHTVDEYQKASRAIELGMTKQEVEQILDPTQTLLPSTSRRQSDRYMKDGVAVTILYYRSGWTSDGLTTDDEFTPHIFNDGKLVAIGWQVLGGVKSTGQVQPVINNSSSSSSTIIVY